ncbi:uracil-xanthine permease family protein [Isachenkonia alkalipeptolytica]|uniref:Uracil-xanthine permease n=1 Tax=Isachenkonia alkalipeptolytica TaxID=2565777 RepID=A0AA44BDW3_9CLOT|nr:uracil-xanthine permease family protein [Isachenkonia alkalipeptolytica]NBG88362.1 uracil-xanthine permease [Isachenkonia alkalipeptolytica]
MSESTLAKKMEVSKEQSTIQQNMKRVILGLQHLIAMFGATILVPMITGFDPSVALIAAGSGTLLFHLVTKGKVPVFLGSSFAFIPVILYVASTYGDLAYAQGGLMVAGGIYVILSLLIKKIGIGRIRKYLPAQVVGPMIIVIGLSLIPVAIDMASAGLSLAALTLGTALVVTKFGKGFSKQLSILIAVATGYIVALAWGAVDTAVITEASLLQMPNFRAPKFDIGAILIIAPVVLAVFMEHIGDITTNGEVVGKNFIKDPGLNRTLLGDGIATLFASMIGGPANTTYGENTGVLAITKNYDPAVLRIAAVFAIILGFVAKVGGVLTSIPVAVMGGISLMLFSMIALVGVKTLKKNKDVAFQKKNLVVIASILLLGLGTSYLETYTGIVIGIPVTEGVQITGLSLAAILGVALNAVLNRGEAPTANSATE